MDASRLRVLFIVDYRSEISRGWVQALARLGHAVAVVSTFPPPAQADSLIPVTAVNLAFSRLVELRSSEPRVGHIGLGRRVVGRVLSTGSVRRLWHSANSSLVPLEVRRHRTTVEESVRTFQPDVIHAMRIPYEAVLATSLRTAVPILVSTWGNDLTLWAHRRRRMAAATERVLRRADALHCDCHRDVRLAARHGFAAERPTVVLPGGGGVDRRLFRPGRAEPTVLERLGIPTDRPLVVNPRGIREYVRNDTFLEAWRLVQRTRPDAFAVCVGMAGSAPLDQLRRTLGIEASLRLLPHLAAGDLAEVFRAAQLSVSPSVHDGTPNTLLEAMASACTPVAGDIESIREWITDGENGLLFDASDPASIAAAIDRGLSDDALRSRARHLNAAVIAERADRDQVMERAVEFYRELAFSGTTCRPEPRPPGAAVTVQQLHGGAARPPASQDQGAFGRDAGPSPGAGYEGS